MALVAGSRVRVVLNGVDVSGACADLSISAEPCAAVRTTVTFYAAPTVTHDADGRLTVALDTSERPRVATPDLAERLRPLTVREDG